MPTQDQCTTIEELESENWDRPPTNEPDTPTENLPAWLQQELCRRNAR